MNFGALKEIDEPRIFTPPQGLILGPQKRIAGPEENVQLIEDPAVLRDTVKDLITRWFETTGQSIYFLSLDGIAGSGKTTLCEMIDDIVAQMNVNLKVHPFALDDFIATDRDDPMRTMMTQSPELFWTWFYSKSQALKTLTDVSRINGEGGKIDIERKYNRSLGKVGPGSIEIPKGRKIVLIEGVNATEIASMMPKNADCSLLKMLFMVDPAVALKRASIRDALQGRRSPKDSEKYRTDEYRHMVPKVFGQNAFDTDIIFTG